MINPSHNDLRETLEQAAAILAPMKKWESGKLAAVLVLIRHAIQSVSALQAQGVPPGSGALEALDELESACKSATEYGADILLIDYVRPLLGKVRAAFPQATPGESSAPAPAAPGALVWTREKPTVEGYYWTRLPATQEAEIARIEGAPVGMIVFRHCGLSGEVALTNPEREWAGPIPAPAGPSGEGRP